MANKFNIIITATDRGTQVVRKFKDQIAQIVRPVRQTMGSFKKFGKELGLDKIAKGFVGVTKFAAGATTKIFGMGAALAGIAAAASLKEIGDAIRDWVFSGTKVVNFSAIIGAATTRVQSLSAVARVFGLDAGTMETALQNVGDAMQDAVFGRNQEALVMMNRLHIQLKRTKDGAVDTAAAIMDIARAVSRQRSAQAQAVIARAFGVDGLLPLLQKGPAYIALLERQVAATRSLMDPDQLKHASEFQQKISLLSLAIDGLGNSLATRLIPFLGPAVSGLTGLIEKIGAAISQHREWESLRSSFFGSSGANAPGSPRGLLGRGGVLGSGVTVGPPKPGTPGVWDWRHWFDFSDVHAPQGNQPPPKNSPAYDDWLAHRRDRRNAFQMPAFDPKQGRPDLNALIRQHKGDIDKALADFAAQSQPNGLVNKKTGGLDKITADFIRRVHAEPGLLAAMRGGGETAPGKPSEVIVRFANTPAGTRVTQKPGGANTQLRIDYALPDLASP